MPRLHRSAALAALCLSPLAAPAAASAHGSVWQETARIIPNAAAPGTLQGQTRYVVSNHGYAYVLRETNGRTARGMLNFQKLPGAYRNQAAKTANDKEAWFEEGDSGAQPHATCAVPLLTGYATIGAWQGRDPFYGYVPFQKITAGLEDDPATWIGVVKSATGVDLAALDTPAQFEQACESLPGATASSYAPADTFNSPPTPANPLAPWTALTSSTIAEQRAEAEAPLRATIAARDTTIAGLRAELADMTTQLGQLRGRIAELETSRQAAEQASAAASTRLQRATTPLGIGVSATAIARRQLLRGLSVSVTGPAGERALVRVVVARAGASALGLRSRVLASETVTLADPATPVTLRPAGAPARALAGLRTTTPITVDVFAGGRSVRTTASLER